MDRNEKKIALKKQIQDSTKELQGTAESLKDLSRDLLVVGGILVAAYSLMKVFQSNEPNTNDTLIEIDNEPSIVASTLKGVATSVLLAIAKNKLSEYIENLDNANHS
ncbi:MAG: hypothetical protein ACI9QN_002691 [Arcticibacterium sp.]